MRTDIAARTTGAVPPERIVRVDIPRHSADFSARLLAIPDTAATVADALDEFGIGAVIGSGGLQPVDPAARLCGPAVTLRWVPVGADAAGNRRNGVRTVQGDRDLYGLAQPGDIGVVDCSGVRTAAVLGALSARWAVKAGLGGCVVDGAVRDTASVRDTGLPVWAAAHWPASARFRLDAVALNGPITLCGNGIRPGDYIVADVDGVCVIPFADVPRVVGYCEDAHRSEIAFTARIDEAASLEELVAGLRPGTSPA